MSKSNKLTDSEKGFIHLIVRSPDRGDGWRTVSKELWSFVLDFTRQELIEVGDYQVRLTPAGQTIATYLT